ncbi:MAG: hypothetical protein KBF47_14670, partial [Gemmatimonadales bacterium]|nr:hypothetical protein [Gemmatimonadales bacterium]
AVALAESAMGGPYATASFGAKVILQIDGSANRRPGGSAEEDAEWEAALLYGEDQGRVLVSVHPKDEAAVLALAAEHGVPALVLGTVGVPGGEIVIVTRQGRYAWAVERLREVYHAAIPRRMARVE